jgi:hypothetical protein
LGDAEVFHLQMKPRDEEKFELQSQLTHILLVVATPIFWAHNHVGSLRAMCALHKLKFDYITFIQRCTSFPPAIAVQWTKTSGPSLRLMGHIPQHQ